ncbi:hypothetical protein PR048_000659 [Dryococelus australis]|uniref:Uncharacterized protein n=1 Tax=Dryococelus australis TaxID=614101 RepID=A0ABQ9IF96_9NEOP|nr:hypothetical protein PR048_000659 [Dryococelus australis]
MKGRENREIPGGIEPESPWWEASRLTAQPSYPSPSPSLSFNVLSKYLLLFPTVTAREVVSSFQNRYSPTDITGRRNIFCGRASLRLLQTCLKERGRLTHCLVLAVQQRVPRRYRCLDKPIGTCTTSCNRGNFNVWCYRYNNVPVIALLCLSEARVAGEPSGTGKRVCLSRCGPPSRESIEFGALYGLECQVCEDSEVTSYDDNDQLERSLRTARISTSSSADLSAVLTVSVCGAYEKKLDRKQLSGGSEPRGTRRYEEKLLSCAVGSVDRRAGIGLSIPSPPEAFCLPQREYNTYAGITIARQTRRDGRETNKINLQTISIETSVTSTRQKCLFMKVKWVVAYSSSEGRRLRLVDLDLTLDDVTPSATIELSIRHVGGTGARTRNPPATVHFETASEWSKARVWGPKVQQFDPALFQLHTGYWLAYWLQRWRAKMTSYWHQSWWRTGIQDSGHAIGMIEREVLNLTGRVTLALRHPRISNLMLCGAAVAKRRVTGFSYVRIVPDDAVGRRVFSGISHFPRPFIPALLHTSITLIGSEDLAVKSRPDLFIHATQVNALTAPATSGNHSLISDAFAGVPLNWIHFDSYRFRVRTTLNPKFSFVSERCGINVSWCLRSAVHTWRTQQEPLTRVESGETECTAATHERAARHLLNTCHDVNRATIIEQNTAYLATFHHKPIVLSQLYCSIWKTTSMGFHILRHQSQEPLHREDTTWRLSSTPHPQPPPPPPHLRHLATTRHKASSNCLTLPEELKLYPSVDDGAKASFSLEMKFKGVGSHGEGRKDEISSCVYLASEIVWLLLGSACEVGANPSSHRPRIGGCYKEEACRDRRSARGDRDMSINSLLASTRKTLNWRAVMPSIMRLSAEALPFYETRCQSSIRTHEETNTSLAVALCSCHVSAILAQSELTSCTETDACYWSVVLEAVISIAGTAVILLGASVFKFAVFMGGIAVKVLALAYSSSGWLLEALETGFVPDCRSLSCIPKRPAARFTARHGPKDRTANCVQSPDRCGAQRRTLSVAARKIMGEGNVLALNNDVLRADEGEARWLWRGGGMQRRRKREIPEKTNEPAASHGTNPICENPGTASPGIEPDARIPANNCFTKKRAGHVTLNDDFFSSESGLRQTLAVYYKYKSHAACGRREIPDLHVKPTATLGPAGLAVQCTAPASVIDWSRGTEGGPLARPIETVPATISGRVRPSARLVSPCVPGIARSRTLRVGGKGGTDDALTDPPVLSSTTQLFICFLLSRESRAGGQKKNCQLALSLNRSGNLNSSCGLTALRPPNRQGRGITSSRRKATRINVTVGQILSPNLARPHNLALSTTEVLRPSPSETKRRNRSRLPLTARSVIESGNVSRPPPQRVYKEILSGAFKSAHLIMNNQYP